MEFQREHAKVVLTEGFGLLMDHYDEVSANLDIPLEPDNEKYFLLEEHGAIRVYTVRENGELIGYAAFFLSNHPHYRKSLQANQDVIFIRKDKRGFGKQFMQWCDEQLKDEGVQIVYHHVKNKHNWGAVLERMGYEKCDQIFSRRLDRE